MNKCPICGHHYVGNDVMVEYHVQYTPVQITTDSCKGCNWAEYLIRNPDIPRPDSILRNIEAVKRWTLKNRPLIL